MREFVRALTEGGKPPRKVWIGAVYKGEVCAVPGRGMASHEKLRIWYGDKFRYCPENGTFYWWELPDEQTREAAETFISKKVKPPDRFKHAPLLTPSGAVSEVDYNRAHPGNTW